MSSNTSGPDALSTNSSLTASGEGLVKVTGRLPSTVRGVQASNAGLAFFQTLGWLFFFLMATLGFVRTVRGRLQPPAQTTPSPSSTAAF
jgi:hypothetical protein